jgi:tetratricopeptide (TPR) repeat protein
MGEIAKAEEVVRHALSRVGDSSDPYMRVRLYWSIARLAHTQGREAVALENVRKAIALLQATDDTFHLARAHVLAAEIMLGRSDATAAEKHLEQAEQLFGGGRTPDDTMEITQLRSRLELLRGNAIAAIAFAREALALCTESQKMEQGISAHALADALALADEVNEAGAAYKQAVELLEATGQWRPASTAARAWGRLLREQGQESDALDVLDRAAELGMRASPEGIRAER